MRVAVVTGGSKGLGKEIAIVLGRSGYRVAVNYHHSAAEAESVAQLAGDGAVAVKADVRSFGEAQEMAGEVYKRWGRIDALINNAGVAKDGLMIRYGEDDWDDVLRVNLKGCFNAVKAVAPFMIQTGGGHIINISSRSGLRGKAGQVAYSASKASVLGFTFSLAKELAPHNIKANCVLPGYMPTEMGRRAKDAMEAAKRESLLGRCADAGEIAGFVTYLLKTETITGQVFCLDSRI